MGIKPRRRRLRNFEQRAKAFVKTGLKREATREVIFWNKRFVVGTGEHRRLIAKEKTSHLKTAMKTQKLLLDLIKQGKIVPMNYVLEEAKGAVVDGIPVQEFFHAPSLRGLGEFLLVKETGKGTLVSSFLSKDDKLMCKKMAAQHRGIP